MQGGHSFEGPEIKQEAASSNEDSVDDWTRLFAHGISCFGERCQIQNCRAAKNALWHAIACGQCAHRPCPGAGARQLLVRRLADKVSRCDWSAIGN